MDAPQLVTQLPGPLAARMIAEDEQYTSPSYTRVYPLAVARGEGAVIEDVDGNRFLDFTAGIAVNATGHCHPRIVRAIQEQAAKLIHMSGTDFYYAPQKDLCRKLAELAPGPGAKRVFLTNSGTESVEAAIKLARRHTGRAGIIAFRGAFHGRTMGALSLTGSKVLQRKGFGPLVPGVVHATYPYCFRCPIRPATGCCEAGLDELENQIFTRTTAPDEVAAIVVEPIQGEGGYIVPPDGFLQRLRDITRRHGILLVIDEVQSGMGRTGKMFAIEHWGVDPDILCLAKGIASGMPLGAIIAPEPIMNWPPGSHASTFGGNPIACAAALETIALLEEELMENAQRVGRHFMDALRVLAKSDRRLGDVRGKGLMIGCEVVDPQGKPDAKLREQIVQQAFHQGLLLLGCGPNTIRFCPPLIVTMQQCDVAASILKRVLAAA